MDPTLTPVIRAVIGVNGREHIPGENGAVKKQPNLKDQDSTIKGSWSFAANA